jgi:hypothetical protein
MQLIPDKRLGDFDVQAQGTTDFSLDAFAVGELLCIATADCAIYVSKDQAKAFFGLKDDDV